MIVALKGLFSSKKFWSAILGTLAAAVCDHLGIDQQTVYGILGLFGVQIAGQGLADSGKERTRLKVEAVRGELVAATEGLDPAERAAALADAGGE